MAERKKSILQEAKMRLQSIRKSKSLILLIVSVAMMLESMLTTVVVPIIPGFLYELSHNQTVSVEDSTLYDMETTTLPPLAMEPMFEGEIDLNVMNFEAHEDFSNITSSEDEYRKHLELIHDNMETSFLFASKAVVQLIANPFVAPITDRLGFSIPLFGGFIIMFTSTLIFAFGKSYGVLFFARSLQGIGSSLTSVSGMGMLADQYPDDKERGNAMSVAMAGLALGLLIGPSFGGLMYEYVSKTSPFLILAFLALGDGLLQLTAIRPKKASKKEEDEKPSSIMKLLVDPYIIIAAGSSTFANMGIALLEASLPIHMMDVMDSSKTTQGLLFLAPSIGFLLGTRIFGPVGFKLGRWCSAMGGIIVIGICLIVIPYPRSPYTLIPPLFILGFAIGIVEATITPELGHIVDLRHSSAYGGVYAIGDGAVCLGFALGPLLSGTFVKVAGFKYVLIGIGTFCLMYSPLLIFLKNPTKREEKPKKPKQPVMKFVEKIKPDNKFSINFGFEAEKSSIGL